MKLISHFHIDIWGKLEADRETICSKTVTK